RQLSASATRPGLLGSGGDEDDQGLWRADRLSRRQDHRRVSREDLLTGAAQPPRCRGRECAAIIGAVSLMSEPTDANGPLARRAYAGSAARYAGLAPTKPHNALYERPAVWSLLGDVRGLRVLDAGCGPGINAETLARAGATVHAFDVTPEMVA